MSPSNMLTQEQIDAGLLEAKAAVERGRQAIERNRAVRAKTGLTPEKLNQFVSERSPRARVWINSVVASGLAEIQPQKPAATKSARKPRALV